MMIQSGIMQGSVATRGFCQSLVRTLFAACKTTTKHGHQEDKHRCVLSLRCLKIAGVVLVTMCYLDFVHWLCVSGVADTTHQEMQFDLAVEPCSASAQ